jgi:LPXTG-motif cell wall-anchored protein
MTFKRVLASIGVTAITAGTLAFGTGAAFAADTRASLPASPIVVPTSPLVTAPTSYPQQTDLTVPAKFAADASLNRDLIPYDEIAPKINSLMDNSNRVSAQVVGKSALGRDIYLVTVTGSETAEETAQQTVWRDKIKHNAAAAANDAELQAGYKVPIWFNANIHGNEWEGTDATLNYIEKLSTSAWEDVEELLDGHRLYFTVVNNPDGRALGQRANGDNFDANRDMITGATPESRVIRDLTAIIQPTFYVDIHGYTSVLQIEPCGPPHGENYEYDLFLPHAYDAALAMEKAVVDANIPGNTYLSPTGDATLENTGKVKIPYRDIRAGWDDWPPIFTPQYVAYQGAITNTVELPLGRVSDPATGIANAVVDVEVARVVIETAVDYVVENSDALLANQIEIFRRGDAGEPLKTIPADIDPATVPAPNAWAEIWDETDVYTAALPRAYVIPMNGSQRSNTDAATLVDQLLVHGVEVNTIDAPYTVNGVTYPMGSYLIDMHQPLRGMANVLLADGSDISTRVPDMYDISAWSLSLLWGADVDAIGSTTDAAPAVAYTPITASTPTGSLPAKGSYLELETSGVAEYQAINALLDADVPVSVFEDGSVILGPDDATRVAAADVVADYGVEFEASTGDRLLDEESRGLTDIRVGYSGAQDDRQSLQKMGFTDLVPVTAATLQSGEVDLGAIDVLWIASNLNITAEQPVAKANVEAFIASGKGVVGRGTAVAAFANTYGLVSSTATTGTGGSNGIVNVTTPAESLFALASQDTAFITPATWYTALGANAVVEQTYATEDVFISGHWADSATGSRSFAAGQASIVSAEAASGSKVLMFGTSPLYRTHPVGAFSQVARGLFWVGADGAEVPEPVISPEPEPTEPGTTPTPVPTEPGTTPTPVPTEPGTTPTPAPTTVPAAGSGTTALPASALTADNRGGVSVNPSTASIGSKVTVTVGTEHAGDKVHAWIYSSPLTLGAHTVSAAGTISVTLPTDIALGAHRIAVLAEDGSLIGWDDITLVDPDGLANTGVEITGMVTLAVLLLLAGGAGVLIVRRRRDGIAE